MDESETRAPAPSPIVPAVNPADSVLRPVVGTIGRPFQKGEDERRNTVPPPVQWRGGRSRTDLRALARQALHKSRALARLIQIAKTGKDRDSMEAIKLLALIGYTQTIFTGTRALGDGGAGGIPLPPSGEEEEEPVQFYLPGARDPDKKAESA